MHINTFIGNVCGSRTNPLGRDRNPDAPEMSKWMMKLNDLVGRRWPGASLMDLNERPWDDWFYDGDTPERGLQEIEMDQGAELDARFQRRA